MTQIRTYPFQSLMNDYIRAAIGFGICIAPIAHGARISGAIWALVVCAVLFALYAARTMLRQFARVVMTDMGIQSTALVRREIPWSQLSELKLSYFSTRRGKDKGWMQLRLRGNNCTLRFDSALNGFEEIVRRASEAARANNLELHDITVQNLTAMGISQPDEAI